MLGVIWGTSARTSITRRICLAALWFWTGAVAGHAQTERPLTDAERTQFAAVGRVNEGVLVADGTCTGTLISPTRVLTASHCVKGVETTMTFLAGFHGGRALQQLRAEERSRHPFSATSGLSLATIPFDLAMLHVPTTQVAAPLPLGPDPQVGEDLTIVSYRNSAKDSATLTTPCNALAINQNVVTLSCIVVSGMSGAPVLRMTEDGPEIVAVLIARGNGVSYAAVPDGWPILP